MTASYLDYYRLTELPFGLTSDPRFAFESRAYAQALADVTSAVERREGVVAITGGPGTGKTLLCRALVGSLDPETRLTAVPSPYISGDELTNQIVEDVSPLHPEQLEAHLRDLAARGSHSVVMIDEAQHLTADALEQIRLLSNLEHGEARLLQIVLVGQPDLRTLLARQAPSLDQRVARRCVLHPMAPDEVGGYIAHRLETAGAVPEGLSFSPDAFPVVARLTRGVPRLVNQLCDRALEVGAERDVRVIDRVVIQAAAERLDLSQDELDVQTTSRVPVLASVAAALAVVAVGLWLWVGREGRNTVARVPTTETAKPTSAPAAVDSPQPGVPPAASPAVPLVGTIQAADSVLVDVAEFPTEGQADKVVKDLATRGLPVFSRFDAQRNVHAVIVGPYVSRDEALEAQKRMDALNYAKTRIAVEPPR